MKAVAAFVAVSGALSVTAAASPADTLTKRSVTPVTVKGNGVYLAFSATAEAN
jgi:hypothetical protein